MVAGSHAATRQARAQAQVRVCAERLEETSVLGSHDDGREGSLYNYFVSSRLIDSLIYHMKIPIWFYILCAPDVRCRVINFPNTPKKNLEDIKDY